MTTICVILHIHFFKVTYCFSHVGKLSNLIIKVKTLDKTENQIRELDPINENNISILVLYNN